MAARSTARQTLAALLCILALPLLAAARSDRSPSARAEFKRQQPCPVTGRATGACPGWQIDHIVPLKCDGADQPHNMQWLTVEDHKAKTKREARWCRKARQDS